MARWFRLLEKKRGDRHTVSQRAAGVWEAVLFGGMFLISAAWLSALVASQFVSAAPAAFTIGYGFWLLALLLSSFVMIGGSGVIWSVLQMGTSAERRSALASRAQNLAPDKKKAKPQNEFPGIPTYEGLTDSPGTELAYRLPSDQSPAWSLLAATTFCLLWNGSVFGLVGYAIQSHIAGDRPEWLLTALLAPFAAVGGWSIYFLAQLLYRLTGLGPTTVEISAHPLLPGEEYEIVISQGGHIHINNMEVWLVCEEEATYRQGTDVRTESRVVFEERLFQVQNVDINPAEPYKKSFRFEVPVAAMHSFQSPHNGVQWRLVADGSIAGWSDFERGFPVIVHPGEKTTQAWEPSPAKFLPSVLTIAPAATTEVSA